MTYNVFGGTSNLALSIYLVRLTLLQEMLQGHCSKVMSHVCSYNYRYIWYSRVQSFSGKAHCTTAFWFVAWMQCTFADGICIYGRCQQWIPGPRSSQWKSFITERGSLKWPKGKPYTLLQCCRDLGRTWKIHSWHLSHPSLKFCEVKSPKFGQIYASQLSLLWCGRFKCSSISES